GRVAESLYRVRIGYVDEARLGGIAPDATVVFVMNHRSNMDYVVATYLAADHAALSYAVGEWARIWPLQQLIRAMGAYFVRRNSRDELYRRVLERYVAMATENGVTQALYPEGVLTRDGRMREPKRDAPGRRFSAIELKAEVERRVERLERAGARMGVPRRELDDAVAAGLEGLALRHLVACEDGLYRAVPAEADVLRYYANSIAHLH